MPNPGDWIRSKQSMALLWAAMVMCLLLGVAFVVVNEPAVQAPNLSAEPLTDEQAAAQVVDAARQVVAVAPLREPAGGYAYVSCKNAYEPPYQAAASREVARSDGRRSEKRAWTVQRSPSSTVSAKSRGIWG